MDVPDVLDDQRPRHRTPGVAHQELEHRELLRLQVDRPAAPARGAADRVELEIPDAQHVLPRGAAPQQRAQPGRQLREREGLHHVVVRARIEAGDPFFHRILRCQDQHRQRRLPRPDVTKHLEP